jgi:hypothetical protein
MATDPVLLVFDSLILLTVFQKSIYSCLSSGYRISQKISNLVIHNRRPCH